MENPEKLATMGTQDTAWRNTKQNTQHRKLKRWAAATSWQSLYPNIHKQHKHTWALLQTYVSPPTNICEPPYKQLDVKTNRTSFVCGHRNFVAVQIKKTDRKYVSITLYLIWLIVKHKRNGYFIRGAGIAYPSCWWGSCYSTFSVMCNVLRKGNFYFFVSICVYVTKNRWQTSSGLHDNAWTTNEWEIRTQSNIDGGGLKRRCFR